MTKRYTDSILRCCITVYNELSTRGMHYESIQHLNLCLVMELNTFLVYAHVKSLNDIEIMSEGEVFLHSRWA